MRLGLSQHLRTEQRLVQSPQMIQAMQILQTPLLELKDQIEQELQENVFLEVKEREEGAEDGDLNGQNHDDSKLDGPTIDDKLQSEFAQELDQLESRTERLSPPSRDFSAEDSDRRLEMLNNTPDTDGTLTDYLLMQVRMTDISENVFKVVEHVICSLDRDGRLSDTAEQIAGRLGVPVTLAADAIDLVRTLDPAGVAARDLRDCLLLQLDSLSYVRPLTKRLVENHLDDLAMNKLPKIAKDTGATIDEIKESWEFLRTHTNPHPGASFGHSMNATVVPDVVVEDVDGQFEVRTLRGSIPELSLSSIYRSLLKEARSDPKVYEYLRRKIDNAKWFIEAVHQRQNTIQQIASEVVKRQTGFLRQGIEHLRPMKMQDVADSVGVHISTVSRAVSGKYMQTPQGMLHMKRFFSGGTVTDSGKVVSQQAVKELLRKIVESEDKQNPYSDDQLVERLASDGVRIARRTVTKYRKALAIESSSRRKEF